MWLDKIGKLVYVFQELLYYTHTHTQQQLTKSLSSELLGHLQTLLDLSSGHSEHVGLRVSDGPAGVRGTGKQAQSSFTPVSCWSWRVRSTIWSRFLLVSSRSLPIGAMSLRKEICRGGRYEPIYFSLFVHSSLYHATGYMH